MNIELKDLQQFRHKSGVYHLIKCDDDGIEDKRTMLDFQHFYFYLFHKTKNNEIKLERDYLENEFLDYTLMIKRNINEYIKLYRWATA